MSTSYVLNYRPPPKVYTTTTEEPLPAAVNVEKNELEAPKSERTVVDAPPEVTTHEDTETTDYMRNTVLSDDNDVPMVTKMKSDTPKISQKAALKVKTEQEQQIIANIEKILGIQIPRNSKLRKENSGSRGDAKKRASVKVRNKLGYLIVRQVFLICRFSNFFKSMISYCKMSKTS